MPHYEYPKSRCRGCGRPIFWGETAEGKKIPLDAIAPVYSVVAEKVPILPGQGEYHLIVERAPGFVSHFATCSKASQFSKRKGGTDEPNHPSA